MNETKRRHHRHESLDGEHVHHDPGPYWKRAHHDWRFWVGVFFMFAAITIYVMSDDLSLSPRSQRQPVPSAVKK